MAKIILRCNYMKNAPPEHLAHYVHYLGTRPRVEIVDSGKGKLPATARQQRLIKQILHDITDAKDMLEYADYTAKPSRENASEFICQALEYNMDIAAKRENYVGYLGTRPRAERLGEHGLFTGAGHPVIMAQVQNEVSEHMGVVWTNVISLRREDAARLGYDSAAQWMELLRSKRAMLSQNLKIQSENLRWYAAFHNESHHPHVHLMVYSTDENEGYLTPQGIEAVRSELAHDIFRQDFAQIYDEQNISRRALKDEAYSVLTEYINAMSSGAMLNHEMETGLLRLAKKLQGMKGKKQFGYMPEEIKIMVDSIVDTLSQDDRVAASYVEWYRVRCKILNTYKSSLPEAPPLSKQKEFRSIKNTVIAEAIKLSDHSVFSSENKSNKTYHPVTAATSILRSLAKLFERQTEEMLDYRAQHDRKAMSKERQKKIALGHAEDDREQEYV